MARGSRGGHIRSQNRGSARRCLGGLWCWDHTNCETSVWSSKRQVFAHPLLFVAARSARLGGTSGDEYQRSTMHIHWRSCMDEWICRHWSLVGYRESRLVVKQAWMSSLTFCLCSGGWMGLTIRRVCIYTNLLKLLDPQAMGPSSGYEIPERSIGR